MFEIRPVTQSVLPSYASFDAVASSPRSSFIANVARPILPVAFAALTLSTADTADRFSTNGPACCSSLDERGAKPSTARAINRLSEESVATIVASLDAPAYEARMRTSGSFGTGSVNINFLTGAEVRELCNSFLTANGITEGQDRLYRFDRGHDFVAEPSLLPDDRDSEIAKIQKGNAVHVVGPGYDRSAMNRGMLASITRRALANRVLLEMERFLEWLDRNAYPRNKSD